MNNRLVIILLLVFGAVFIILLSLFVLNDQSNNIVFRSGFQALERDSLKITQTSQRKEQAITQSVFINKPPLNWPQSEPQTEPQTEPQDEPQTQVPAPTDNSGPKVEDQTDQKSTSSVLQEFEDKLNTTYLWGTYKPHLIHTITQRSPKPITFGFMYIATESGSKLLHSYRDVKASSQYFTEYLIHDGQKFSQSLFEDKTTMFAANNSFFKEKMTNDRQRWHSVTSKLKSGSGFLNNRVSIIYYFLLEDFDGLEDTRHLEYDKLEGIVKVRDAEEKSLGFFKIVVYDNEEKTINLTDVVKRVFVDNHTPKSNTWTVQNILDQRMTLDTNLRFNVIPDNADSETHKANLIVVQLILNEYASFDVHIVYDTLHDFNDVKDNYHLVKTIVNSPETESRKEYQRVFLGEVPDKINESCAISALSNLISGIGYYYGNIKVKDQARPEPNLPMYSGCPSKAGSPRPFLWDEGFHGLVYCKWNAEICIDVLKHWMNTELENGWIPKEQLRGQECISNGNPTSIEQLKDEANPPTLMFHVNALIDYKEQGQLPEGASQMLNALYPKLKKWNEWFYVTQVSETYDGLFTWRSDRTDQGLVLGSGLDDYPRGTEGYGMKPMGHLDLHIWMIFMVENMVKLAEFVGDTEEVINLKDRVRKLKEEMDKFLDPDDSIYKDLIRDQNNNKAFSSHFGYINLFPLFFGLLGKESKELDALLDRMKDPKKLSSPYGLLSLARDDNMYMKTRDRDWGGPIWINMNFLALRGLKLYYSENQKAMDLYQELRKKIIDIVCQEKKRTISFMNSIIKRMDLDNSDFHSMDGLPLFC